MIKKQIQKGPVYVARWSVNQEQSIFVISRVIPEGEAPRNGNPEYQLIVIFEWKQPVPIERLKKFEKYVRGARSAARLGKAVNRWRNSNRAYPLDEQALGRVVKLK